MTEAQEINSDIPEECVTYDQEEWITKKVRPIQIGEFLRKFVSGRLPALSEGEIAAFTAAMHQLGFGSQGGADAIAIFHQFIYNEWASGTLVTPLTRIKVDQKTVLE